MVYCLKCGTQNPDNMQFCGKCGAPLYGPQPVKEKEWDKRCEDECSGGSRGASIFWGIIVILIGAGIAIFALRESSVELPEWLENFDFGLVFGIIIGIALVVLGIRIITKRPKA